MEQEGELQDAGWPEPQQGAQRVSPSSGVRGIGGGLPEARISSPLSCTSPALRETLRGCPQGSAPNPSLLGLGTQHSPADWESQVTELSKAGYLSPLGGDGHR